MTEFSLTVSRLIAVPGPAIAFIAVMTRRSGASNTSAFWGFSKASCCQTLKPS